MNNSDLTFKKSFKINIFILSVIILYISAIVILQSDWWLSGEMYAEMATNYYAISLHHGLIDRLFSTDAGYIPLPQRIIAMGFAFFKTNETLLPFLYNFLSLFLTGLLVAVFCSQRYRIFIPSDTLRFLTCLFILLIVDFETRTFINFTYFAGIFIFFVALLAVDNTENSLPTWCWLTPIFFMSKPQLFVLAPILLLATVIHPKKMGLLTSLSFVFILIQIIRIKISLFHSEASGFLAEEYVSASQTILDKLKASLLYFFGFLSKFSLGPNSKHYLHENINIYLLLGPIFLSLILLLIYFVSRPLRFLILFSILILFFNTVLNCFALPASWNLNLARLENFQVDRHHFGILFSVVLLVVGIAQSLENKLKTFISKNPIPLGLWIFLAWCFFSGWIKLGFNLVKEPSPMTRTAISNWSVLANQLSSKQAICIMIGPYPWIYTHHCQLINPVPDTSQSSWVMLKPHQTLKNIPVFEKNYQHLALHSIGLIAKPAVPIKRTLVNVNAKAYLKNGKTILIFGQKVLPSIGGAIQLFPEQPLALKDISFIVFSSTVPIEILPASKTQNGKIGLLWFAKTFNT